MNKNFALIGAAGYIAPRHMNAIKETKNNLIAAYDPFDSVGIIDSYFPNASFFKEFERFDRHIEKLKIEENKYLDYVSICSPNYLHDAHIRFALRTGANAICEKPLVLNPWNIDKLSRVEESTGNKVFNVLQLRVHSAVLELKNKIEKSSSNSKFEVNLNYITSRGKWYNSSWKGEEEKSGGVATNIGVHFFDMLSWIFGDLEKNILEYKDNNTNAGYLEFKNARVKWFLSTDFNHLPKSVIENGGTTYRSIRINEEEFEFSGGFKDLHTKVYEDVLKGNGYGLEDTRNAIEIVHSIRNQRPRFDNIKKLDFNFLK